MGVTEWQISGLSSFSVRSLNPTCPLMCQIRVFRCFWPNGLLNPGGSGTLRPAMPRFVTGSMRTMMSDCRLANPDKFAHVRRELGIDLIHKTGAPDGDRGTPGAHRARC